MINSRKTLASLLGRRDLQPHSFVRRPTVEQTNSEPFLPCTPCALGAAETFRGKNLSSKPLMQPD